MISMDRRLYDLFVYILLGSIALIFFTMSAWYKNQYGLFRSDQQSIENLLKIKRQNLQELVEPLTPITTSVSNKLIKKEGIYAQITNDKTALVNWRPLSVRMAGYLGGINEARDGVFDMDVGIKLALDRGARCFIFDIDYLDNKPCEPCLIHRDDAGIMRSLHTGSIKDGMSSLNRWAFETNYDPVIITVYLRRIPSGDKQKSAFFKKVASSLDPLSRHHLGSTDQGNFHNCRSEKILFTSEITNYQKKFIVLCNYNTNNLPATPNPKDNLDFWTNARLYLDPSGKSDSLGSVTPSVENGKIAYAKVGSTTQLLNIPTDTNGNPATTNYLNSTSNTFTIALSSMDYILTMSDISKLLNTLGIQSVPIDVLRLASKKEYSDTLKKTNTLSTFNDLANPVNSSDILSFWKYAGWSRKLIVEGFENMKPVPVARNIPGFVIPKAVVPKQPPPSTNSNGGLVNIV